MTPKTVKREIELSADGSQARGAGLQIEWQDGLASYLSSELLRRSCPCASCRDKPEESMPLSSKRPGSAKLTVLQASVDEATDLVAVWAVGNYALGLRFADAHDSGIFSFELLRKLCEKNSNPQSVNT